MTTPTELRLSTRARSLLESAPRHEYILEHYERAADAFHATDNPDGYIGLAVAENKLVWGLLEPKLTAPRSVPGGAVCYDSMIGSIEFRTRIGEFLERTFIGRPVSVEHMAVLGGAGSVLELLFFMLADPGDGVLVPTPSYAGFWSDLETRDELSIIPVHTRADTGFRLTTAHLDAALAAADRPVKVLLYTNPSNPLGTIAPASEITDVIEWGATNGVHVVIDEIYALSVHGAAPFVSAASLAPSLPRHVHLVWAFSKDFGMSEDEDVKRLAAVRKAVGDDVEIYVDANNGYYAKQAIRMSQIFEQFDVKWFEEPVLADDIEGLSVISQSTTIPVATGEHEYTKYGFKELIVRGGADIVQPDIGRVGGVTEWMKVAHLAHAFNLPVAPHAYQLIHLHVACATPNLKVVEYLGVSDKSDRVWYTEFPEQVNGMWSPYPDRPGLGLELDPAAVKKFKVN